MANELGEIRRSQIIHNFGPGAVVDMRIPGGTVSGIHLGLEEWVTSVYNVDPELESQSIFLKRLKPLTGRTEFRLPPVPKEKFGFTGKGPEPALTLRTFPSWLQCPGCSSLRKIDSWEVATPGKPGRSCPDCSSGKKKKLVFPARFIVACKDGHIDDFPWDWHVQHKSDSCDLGESLQLISTGPGLSGLILSCRNCQAKSSMDGIFNQGFLGGLTCRGSRPWLLAGKEDCNLKGEEGDFRVLQRAGSNVYYPALVTALDIPPGSHFDGKVLGQFAQQFSEILPSQRLAWLESPFAPKKLMENIAKFYAGTPAEFVNEYNTEEVVELEENLRLLEYSAFDTAMTYKDPDFWTKPHAPGPKLSGFIQRVTQVLKLREVRVLTGFHRIYPPADVKAGKAAPISSEELNWLPAIEVRGEGIYVQLDRGALEAWEKNPSVVARVSQVLDRFGEHDSYSGFRPSARAMLLHTLAHILVKQLTLDSGYSSASLRERLFFHEDVVRPGLLIYTGAPDSEGTLGGLQVKGDPSKFESLLIGAIRSADWCSSDPLCLDGQLASHSFFSVASCHSCSMVPETSCELNNMFLDRALISGTLEDPSVGFFSGIEI